MQLVDSWLGNQTSERGVGLTKNGTLFYTAPTETCTCENIKKVIHFVVSHGNLKSLLSLLQDYVIETKS